MIYSVRRGMVSFSFDVSAGLALLALGDARPHFKFRRRPRALAPGVGARPTAMDAVPVPRDSYWLPGAVGETVVELGPNIPILALNRGQGLGAVGISDFRK